MDPMLLPTLEVPTHAKAELVDLTGRIQAALTQARTESGILLVFSPHTTAGITIQENADPDVQRDLLLALETMAGDAAVGGAYRHGEGNSDAHVKTVMTGASQLVPVSSGRLQLGTWQAVYLCEFDGPRTRRVMLQLIPG
jgi:secondary thiamine-phosphate synthase enzyme